MIMDHAPLGPLLATTPENRTGQPARDLALLRHQDGTGIALDHPRPTQRLSPSRPVGSSAIYENGAFRKWDPNRSFSGYAQPPGASPIADACQPHDVDPPAEAAAFALPRLRCSA